MSNSKKDMSVDLNKIKAVAFDFGGTLDVPGMHWFDFFLSLFESELTLCGISRELYWNAYVYGERQMEKHGIPHDTNFRDTLACKLNYQLEYIAGCSELNLNKLPALKEIVASRGVPQIESNLQKAVILLEKLSKRYDLSIVSNYYGNLEAVLKDYGIYGYLNRLVDSTIVGLRKPDSAIWKMAIDQSGAQPENFLIIGDSMKNDIRPAQTLGCPTILITNTTLPAEYQGEWVNSLEMLSELLNC